jgi:predicted transglutaminase-like cysteine proteinase
MPRNRNFPVFLLLLFSIPTCALADANPTGDLRLERTVGNYLNNSDVPPVEPTSPSPIRPAEPFHLEALPIFHGDLLAKWHSVQRHVRAEHEALTRCRLKINECSEEENHFLAIVDDGLAHEGIARIGTINRDINLSIVPRNDREWSTPLETFANGSGDCKDYAIAKYAALREIGIAADDIHILIVRNRYLGAEHAVVAVRTEQKWLILDNRWLALVEDAMLPNFIPIFELGEDGVRQFEIRSATAGERVF